MLAPPFSFKGFRMWPVSSLSLTCHLSLSRSPRSLHLSTISSKCALLVRQLVDLDPELRRAASRAIKHAVIGSWARKALFIEVGVVAGLLESLKKDPDKVGEKKRKQDLAPPLVPPSHRRRAALYHTWWCGALVPHSRCIGPFR